MHFISNVSSHWNLHSYKLAVHAGMQDFAEDAKLADFFGQAFEVYHLVWRRLGLVFVTFGEVGHVGRRCGLEVADDDGWTAGQWLESSGS